MRSSGGCHTSAVLDVIHFQVIHVDTGNYFQAPGIIGSFGQNKVAFEKYADHEIANRLLRRLIGDMQNTT
jgi:hypothetical protein